MTPFIVVAPTSAGLEAAYPGDTRPRARAWSELPSLYAEAPLWTPDLRRLLEAAAERGLSLWGIRDYGTACRALQAPLEALDAVAVAEALPRLAARPGWHRVLPECRTADGWMHAAMRGYRLDVELAERMRAEALDTRARARARWGFEITGTDQQTRARLAEHGVTGSVTAQALALLPPSPFIEDLTRTRAACADLAKVEELLGTAIDGRVYPTMETLGCATGRMAMTGPALQNLGERTRGLLLPDEGMALLGADWAHVEPSVAAWLSGDAQMMADCQPGEELYEPIARAAGISRKAAKRVILAPLYGQGDAGLAETLGCTPAEAAAYRGLVFGRWPRLAAWTREVTSGSYGVTGLGRPLPEPAAGPYARVNYLCQGTARDLLTEATVRIIEHPALGAEALWLPVHDEVVVQVPTERAAEAAQALEECMRMRLGGLTVTASAVVMENRLLHA